MDSALHEKAKQIFQQLIIALHAADLMATYAGETRR